jgi:hypothetical protein
MGGDESGSATGTIDAAARSVTGTWTGSGVSGTFTNQQAACPQ